MPDLHASQLGSDWPVAAFPDLALFRTIVQSVADAVIVTSPSLDAPGPVIEYVNPAFTAMTGYAAGEVIGRSPRLLQGARTDRAVLDQMRAELAAGGPSEGEVVNYRKDGREYVVEWLITALRGEDGRIRHLVSVQRDVTERHRLEERQRVLIAELQHRTRNLLAVARSLAAETLGTGPAIEEYGSRLAALARVQGLLSPDDAWSVQLAELVRVELQAHGAEPGDRVRVDGTPITLPGTMAQPVAMVLHELATNARKHGALARPAGRLEVTWRVEGDDQARTNAAPPAPRLVLCWRESGVPLPHELPMRQGYGRGLIEQALPYQIGAETCFEVTPDGVRYCMRVPLE